MLLFFAISAGAFFSYVTFVHEEEPDFGDLGSFCRMQVDSSLPDLEDNERYYAALVEVAPLNIRGTVIRLKNYSRSFEEIKQEGSIEELFNKAFGSQEIEMAQKKLQEYTQTWCV